MSKATRILSLLLILAICITWLVYALHGYPLLTGDTVCFLPAAIELKNGHGLINPLYHPLNSLESRFIFYPPVFPWVMSLVTPSTSEISIYIGLYVVQVASFLLMLGILFKLYQKFHKLSPLPPVWETLLVLLTVLAASACFGPGYSRPEALCKLFLVSGIYVALTRLDYKLVFIGLLDVASLLTSPVFGAYMLMLTALYIIVSNRFTLKAIVQTGAGVVMGLLLAYVVYPYKVTDLTGGMALHSQKVVFADKGDSGVNLQNFISQHVASTDIPLGIFLFVTAIVVGYFIIVRADLKLRDKVFASLLATGLVLAIIYFSFKTIFMAYYMYVLMPLMITLAFYSVLRDSRMLVVISVLFLAIFAPALRLLAVFVKNGAYGTTYSIRQANLQLHQKYPALAKAEVGYTPSFWPIFINNSKANLVRFHNSPIDTKNGKYNYLVIQQVTSNLTTPPTIPGYRLVEDNFSKDPVTLFGKRIANQPLAYQYAFYERI